MKNTYFQKRKPFQWSKVICWRSQTCLLKNQEENRSLHILHPHGFLFSLHCFVHHLSINSMLADLKLCCELLVEAWSSWCKECACRCSFKSLQVRFYICFCWFRDIFTILNISIINYIQESYQSHLLTSIYLCRVFWIFYRQNHVVHK